MSFNYLGEIVINMGPITISYPKPSIQSAANGTSEASESIVIMPINRMQFNHYQRSSRKTSKNAPGVQSFDDLVIKETRV